MPFLPFIQEKIARGQRNIHWPNLTANPHPSAIELLQQQPERIFWEYINRNTNPEAIRMLNEQVLLTHNNELYDWFSLAFNTSAIGLLTQKARDGILTPEIMSDEAFRFNISSNPNAIPFLQQYPQCIHWNAIWSNPSIFFNNQDLPKNVALATRKSPKLKRTTPRDIERVIGEFLKATFVDFVQTPFQNGTQVIDYEYLSMNPNPKAIEILKKHPENIVWPSLCSNESLEAIAMLETRTRAQGNPRGVLYLPNLCSNPYAVHLLAPFVEEQGLGGIMGRNPIGNIGNIDKVALSKNPAAIHLLEQFPNLINWASIWENPSIFTVPYGIGGRKKQIRKHGKPQRKNLTKTKKTTKTIKKQIKKSYKHRKN